MKRVTDAVLVVDVVDLLDVEPLLLVQRLLLLEDALVEELLQLLVAVVDAELLEAIHLEVLCNTKQARSVSVKRPPHHVTTSHDQVIWGST